MLIGSDFMWEEPKRRRRCSECGWRGKRMLVARRGLVQKIVCSEECRLNFDDKYWQEQADKREHHALKT